MAESRKGSEGLEGKQVEIFLKTPLFRFRYVVDDQERELLENAVRISGHVLYERGAGLTVKVDVLSNMKQTDRALPFDRIFLPYDKIDFIVVV